MKYLESYEDGEIDAFEDFMRRAIANRNAEEAEKRKLETPKSETEPESFLQHTQAAPVKKAIPKKAKKEYKSLKDIAQVLFYDSSTSRIGVSINGKKYEFSGASPYIHKEMIQDIYKNNMKSFFKTIKFLETIN